MSLLTFKLQLEHDMLHCHVTDDFYQRVFVLFGYFFQFVFSAVGLEASGRINQNGTRNV